MRKRTSAPKYTPAQKQTSASKRFLLPVLTAAALGAGFLALAAPTARAGGAVYQQHTVNAGVLVNGADPAPYLFYVLNNRADIRPPDLILVNPLAPASALPNTAAYWEVSLNKVSDSELAQYNVLYLAASGPGGAISFGPALNEKLRRFVDNGGQLIVEYGAAVPQAATPAAILPAPGLFTGTGATAPTTATPLVFPAAGSATLAHPLASQPYFLSSADLTILGNVPNLVPVPPATTPAAQHLELTADTADLLHSTEFPLLFSPVLNDTNGGTVVSAAQLGAGQIIVTTLNIGLGISVDPNYRVPATTGPLTFNPANLSVAPAPDLKLLANIIKWGEAHPNENKTSHENASNAGLASFSPAWQFPVLGAAATAPTPGAAVWGNFVFVTDATGVLHAFDAFPSEYLTGGAIADDGVADYSLGSSYDAIWNTPSSSTSALGNYASAPTVASFNGVNYVFVEKADGSLLAFNAVTGTAAPFTLAAPTPLSQYPALSYPQGSTFNAPSPTYYEGRLYAGQANGNLVVYDLSEGSSAVVPLNSATGLTEPVTGPPAVGLLADGDTNVLVAVVPTPYNVYSVLAGARNEPLQQFLVNNVLTGYKINRSGRYDLNNIFADVNAIAPPLLAYDYAGNVQGVSPNSTAPNPQDPLFSITSPLGFYTDWNMDFTAAVGFGGVNSSQVNLNYVSASPYAEMFTGNPTQATALSAPAMDRHGNYYFTETNGGNSYLIGVAPAPLHNNVHLKFRFLMPSGPFTDAEQVDYGQLSSNKLQFVGSPVIDDQGNVYVLATNGIVATAGAAAVPATRASVLCFRADQQVTAVIIGGSAVDLTQATITQKDEGGGEDNTIQRGPDDPTKPTFGQFISSPTMLTFYNFGKRGRTGQEIAGNVTEPQVMTATDTTSSGSTATLGFRTNLAWFLTPFSVTGSIAGLSQVGDSLFLSDGTTLYRVPTKPQVGTGKIVAAGPFETPIGVGTKGIGTPGVGTMGAPPSIGGNVMVLNGTSAVAALTRQVTVIADSSRILGVDGDGGAVWGIDATTRTDPSTGFATKVAFSHPTALSQFALNDYLVADTGSNRCVRFDSAGNVRWELTRFSDPAGLMAPGQPLTLNQPSSVVVRQPIAPDLNMIPGNNGQPTLENPGGSFVYYLVADSGHNRIIEVEDRVKADGTIFVDKNGNSINHQLTWATHTGDRDGRNYRYGSADYYAGTITVNSVPTPTLFVAATVENTRLAPLAAGGGLGPVSGDAPGGSLVIFQHPQTPSQFSATPVTNDLVYTSGGFYAATVMSGTTKYAPFAIRNPRFLKLYTPAAGATAPNTNVAPFDFLYADDNGAFDLTFNTGGPGPKGFVSAADRLQFKAADYDGMTIPTLGSSTAPPRAGLPFIPTCVQALSTDTQPPATAGGSTITTRRYLITQNYSQGELGGPPSAAPRLGGEVFEIDVSASGTPATANSPATVTSAQSVPVGGFGGQTLSHPDLTGPLTQPTYAVRLP